MVVHSRSIDKPQHAISSAQHLLFRRSCHPPGLNLTVLCCASLCCLVVVRLHILPLVLATLLSATHIHNSRHPQPALVWH